MKYVLAVSGGVDSMVLLNMLVHDRCKSLHIKPEDLIVAHFDHGIREDSSTDEEFVRGVVGDYGLAYETARAELGLHASEEEAREARYNFLRQCCKKYNATLVTAHHQDDLIETMIINLLRGTSWRGLASLNSSSHSIRPLLENSKSELLVYAEAHAIQWHEDSTNTDESYLRNYVRLQLIPQMIKKDPNALALLLKINKSVTRVKKEIATELQKLIADFVDGHEYTLPRYKVIMWPSPVATEVVYELLTRLDPSWHPSSHNILRVVHFIKSGRTHKELEVSGGLKITLSANDARFKNT